MSAHLIADRNPSMFPLRLDEEPFLKTDKIMVSANQVRICFFYLILRINIIVFISNNGYREFSFTCARKTMFILTDKCKNIVVIELPVDVLYLGLIR
jgi:hypothetical protein